MTEKKERRYQLSIGHPVRGEWRDYKTLSGARRAAERLRYEGQHVWLWEGTLRPWGGWSWSAMDKFNQSEH